MKVFISSVVDPLKKLFPNSMHRIQKCYNKINILKVNKFKHIQINVLLYLIFNSFFPNVPILYKMGTWGN